MKNLIIAFALATGVGLVANAADARADVTFTVQTPDLVYAAPGVQVVADYDDPVFFSDGFYWRYDDGIWYRSSVYYGGWEYWDAPPIYIQRINRPYAYSHYRPRGYVSHYRPIAPRHDAHFISRPRPTNYQVHQPGRANVNVHENVRVRGNVHENVHIREQRPMPQPPRAAPHVQGHAHAGGHVEHR